MVDKKSELSAAGHREDKFFSGTHHHYSDGHEEPLVGERRHNNEAAPRKSRSRFGFFLKFLGVSFGLGTVALIGFGIFAMSYMNKLSKKLPPHEVLAEYEPPVSTRVYAGDGSLVAEFATESRLFVPIESIPEHVKNAFISAEDQNFYEHDGLDYRAIVRGMFIQNAINKVLGRNKRLIGASTITQQVAKVFLLSSEQEIERKLNEWLLARRIEKTFTKDHILELYLNQIYLGNRAYGVAAAALNYFDKPLTELTIEEAAYLAAIPKGPSNYHPVRNKERATDRRNWVIGRMFEDEHITESQKDSAQATELLANVAPPLGAREWATEYFAEQVRKEIVSLYGVDALYHGGLAVRTTLDPHLQRTAGKALRRWLAEYDRRHGWRGSMGKIDLTADWQEPFREQVETLKKSRVFGEDLDPWRLAVVLDVDKDKAEIGFADGSDGTIKLEALLWARQYVDVDTRGPEVTSAAQVLKTGDVVLVSPVVVEAKEDEKVTEQIGEIIEGQYALRQIPAINGGFTAIDPHTGRVLAMVGGFSFQLSEFNRAIQALRQPGSTFKPFIYALALDSGYSPSSLVLDAPFVAPTINGEWWRPGNYIEGTFGGPSTLRKGIEKSRNTMTARLAQDLGIGRIIDYVKKFDLSDNMPRELAISLGSGETTLIRITSAYSIFVNGGKKIKPRLIDRIQDRTGRTIFKRDNRPCPECRAEKWEDQAEPELPDDREQIVDPRTAYQMVSILEGVVRRGTGSAIRRVLDKPTAGKTGTTNDYKDAWFVGFSPDLAAGVYVGFDLPRTLGKREAGGTVAAPIFGEFMVEALKDQSGIPFRVPSGVRLVRVNADTGQPAQFGENNLVIEAFKFSDRIGDTTVLDGSSALDPLSSAPGVPARDDTNLGGVY